jgi:hypothetical protein
MATTVSDAGRLREVMEIREFLKTGGWSPRDAHPS